MLTLEISARPWSTHKDVISHLPIERDPQKRFKLNTLRRGRFMLHSLGLIEGDIGPSTTRLSTTENSAVAATKKKRKSVSTRVFYWGRLLSADPNQCGTESVVIKNIQYRGRGSSERVGLSGKGKDRIRISGVCVCVCMGLANTFPHWPGQPP